MVRICSVSSASVRAGRFAAAAPGVVARARHTQHPANRETSWWSSPHRSAESSSRQIRLPREESRGLPQDLRFSSRTRILRRSGRSSSCSVLVSPSLRWPSSRSAWRSQLRSVCGPSNAQVAGDLTDQLVAGADQPDRFSAELARIGWTAARHMDSSPGTGRPQRRGVHQNGSTPALAGVRAVPAVPACEGAPTLDSDPHHRPRWPKRGLPRGRRLPGGPECALPTQAKGAGMMAPRLPPRHPPLLRADRRRVGRRRSTCSPAVRALLRPHHGGRSALHERHGVRLANGASGVRVEPGSADERALGEALEALLRQLALEIVSDGEGAVRVGRVVVRGGRSGRAGGPRGGRLAAREDGPPRGRPQLRAGPPGGRPGVAAGRAVRGRPRIEGRQLVSGGDAATWTRRSCAMLEQAVRASEVEYALRVPGEGGEAELFFSDLSHDYVNSTRSTRCMRDVATLLEALPTSATSTGARWSSSTAARP